MPSKDRRRAALKHPRGAAPDAVPTAESSLYRVGPAARIKPGESFKFLMPIHGAEEECFIVNYHGQLYGYVNRCRHIPMPMDWIDNQFFAEQGRYLLCPTHCAYYEPATGECIAGPQGACGKYLYRVPLKIKRGVIFATPPTEEFEDD